MVGLSLKILLIYCTTSVLSMCVSVCVCVCVCVCMIYLFRESGHVSYNISRV